jgi:hypothetical protein
VKAPSAKFVGFSGPQWNAIKIHLEPLLGPDVDQRGWRGSDRDGRPIAMTVREVLELILQYHVIRAPSPGRQIAQLARRRRQLVAVHKNFWASDERQYEEFNAVLAENICDLTARIDGLERIPPRAPQWNAKRPAKDSLRERMLWVWIGLGGKRENSAKFLAAATAPVLEPREASAPAIRKWLARRGANRDQLGREQKAIFQRDVEWSASAIAEMDKRKK